MKEYVENKDQMFHILLMSATFHLQSPRAYMIAHIHLTTFLSPAAYIGYVLLISSYHLDVFFIIILSYTLHIFSFYLHISSTYVFTSRKTARLLDLSTISSSSQKIKIMFHVFEYSVFYPCCKYEIREGTSSSSPLPVFGKVA